MPQIISRPHVGSTSEEQFRQPRTSVTASTGMNLPRLDKNVAPQAEEVGQKTVGVEDKLPEAVTLSPQLTALARKQQEILKKEQALAARESALQTNGADSIQKSQLKAKFESNAVEALLDLGYTYDQITNLIIEQSSAQDPNQQIIKKLEDEVKGIKTANEENINRQFEATKAQYKKQIDALVESDTNFSTIKEDKKQEAVLQHILDTFNEDGVALSVEEAAKDIEDFLVEEAMRYANFTKVKAKQNPPAESEQPTQKTLPPPKTGLRTLTQAVSTAPTRTHNQFQHLSMKERIEQAIARAQK